MIRFRTQFCAMILSLAVAFYGFAGAMDLRMMVISSEDLCGGAPAYVELPGPVDSAKPCRDCAKCLTISTTPALDPALPSRAMGKGRPLSRARTRTIAIVRRRLSPMPRGPPTPTQIAKVRFPLPMIGASRSPRRRRHFGDQVLYSGSLK